MTIEVNLGSSIRICNWQILSLTMRPYRELHLEHAARPFFGLADPNAAALLSHERAGDVQAQAGAGLFALQLRSQPHETAENFRRK